MGNRRFIMDLFRYLFIFGLVVAAVSAAAVKDETFEEFEEEFGQLTNDEELEEKEEQALEDSEKEIDEINEEYDEGKSDIYEKLNELSDVPEDEWDNTDDYHGLNMPSNSSDRFGMGLVFPNELPVDRASEEFFNNFRMNRAYTPSEFDATKLGYVTPVKHQQQCGSCASFASVATVETCIKKLSGNEADLSEQQLMDCGYNGGSMNGCNGAAPHAYHDWLKSNLNGQLTHEYNDPYQNRQTSCSAMPAYNPGAKVVNSYYSYQMDENTMKGLVAQYGAVVTGIYASDKAFQNYGGGIYMRCQPGVQANHAVVVVGYGTENGVPYWKVKNSWGTNWGENGFFRMYRGSGMCNIGSTLSMPICQASNGAVSPPVTTPAPPASATCDISALYGPGHNYSQVKLTTNINGVDYTATCKLVNSVCTLISGSSSNACMSICGQTSCNGFGRSLINTHLE